MRKFKERYRYSVILLKQLVKTDFRIRYQGSFLGYLWSLLRPLALFAILYIVFAQFLRFGDAIPNFPVYLLFGIVLWNYFVEVTNNGVGAIVGRGDLIRKINFPKYVIVFALSLSALINLAINMVVLGLFIWGTGVAVRPIVVLLPLILLELFVLALALSFLLSALYVRYRDVNYIWEVIMQAAFYATPIIYPLSLIPNEAAKILMLSPVAQIIQDARYVLITPETTTISQLYGTHLVRIIPLSITVSVCVLAVAYFRKRSKFFAEEV